MVLQTRAFSYLGVVSRLSDESGQLEEGRAAAAATSCRQGLLNLLLLLRDHGRWHQLLLLLRVPHARREALSLALRRRRRRGCPHRRMWCCCNGSRSRRQSTDRSRRRRRRWCRCRRNSLRYSRHSLSSRLRSSSLCLRALASIINLPDDTVDAFLKGSLVVTLAIIKRIPALTV